MTLDAAEVLQVTEVAARVAAEQIRNLARGTGGANMPMPVTRPGTVAGDADAGKQVSVRADADVNAVPAVNATGFPLSAGERVLIQWVPPLGVYVTHILDRSQRGLWTPSWTGTGTNSTGTTRTGTYYRVGDAVLLRAKMVFGSGSAVGTQLQMGNMPWPVKTSGDAVPAHGFGHFWSGANRQPLAFLVNEGQSVGDIQCWSQFAAPGFPTLASPTSTTPFTWAIGNEVNVTIAYETDAA